VQIAAQTPFLSKLNSSDKKLVSAALETVPKDSLQLLDSRGITLKLSTNPTLLNEGVLGRYRRSAKEVEVTRATLPGSEKSFFFGSRLRAITTTAAGAAVAALASGILGPVAQMAGLVAGGVALAIPAISALWKQISPSQTLTHELTHALDHAVGQETMYSRSNPDVEACFQASRARGTLLSPVAGTKVEEYFAECGAAYLNTSAADQPLSRQRLANLDPNMCNLMENFFQQVVPQANRA